MNKNTKSNDLGNPESSNEIIILSDKDKQNASHKAQNISEEKKIKLEKKINFECKRKEQAFLKNKKNN